MPSKRYMIKDAAAIVNVESHVLRYWEDELELTIPRNEMGHRYYTKENIDQFQQIKEMKEEGYQLKVIRMMLHNQGTIPEGETGEMNKHPQSEYQYQLQKVAAQNGHSEMLHQPDNSDKFEQFQNMMTDIVRQAIQENNRALGREVGEQVEEKVIKEMNYLMREQDEQEEERYRKLDEAIRSYAQHHGKREKENRLFRKKQELKPTQA